MAPSSSMRQSSSSYLTRIWVLLLLFLISITQTSAAFVRFTNCLEPAIQRSRSLQFIPLLVDAHFDAAKDAHKLSLTIYGNVTGLRPAEQQRPPIPPLDPAWQNPEEHYGKIVNITDNITTLFTEFKFLTYTAYHAKPAVFCDATLGRTCPWEPLFGKNASNPKQLHAFNVSHELDSSFAFSTIMATMKIQSPDRGAPFLGCINVNISPDLGQPIAAAIRWIPIVVLALVGLATILAARFHPSSSKNFFYWSSSYGRDEDMIRLVTPGFGDCLQYIQFIVLTGSLSLNYPGYYQPVISNGAWSTLTFNESFVSRGNGSQSLVDGFYNTNSTYGLSNLAELVGMTEDSDIWAGMAVWLMVIIGIAVVLCQLGFLTNWILQKARGTEPQDLRSKNFPFTAGQVTRIIYNYFLLPIVALSIYQLVITGQTPGWAVALAVVFLAAIIGFAIWTFYLIFTTNPRMQLFDHLPSLLLYGPLYNTYSDEAAPFAIIPVVLNIIRGIAIGAVQPSGIAQLVILAVCEIIFILTIHAFHPFKGVTSMNAYHTTFSVVRFVALIMSVTFVPSLEVEEGIKGWIGYVILLLHAMVLLFGFFMNSIQTLIEVFSRMTGAGETAGGVLKIFGVRQLSKRVERHHSLHSSTAMLEVGAKSPQSHRLTSMSLVSQGRHSSFGRHSSVDRFSQMMDGQSQNEGSSLRSGPSPGPSTPGIQATTFSFLPNNGEGQHNQQFKRHSTSLAPPAPYYRAPRQRHSTLGSTSENEDVELQAADSHQAEAGSPEKANVNRRYSILSSAPKDDPEELRKQSEYYASRESDFLYGVQRGPALSNSASTRRRVTGPGDPMSPVTAASGWFKGLFSGRKKDKAKGFEVVRSTPLHLLREQDEDEHPGLVSTPYQDNPQLASPENVHATSGREISQADIRSDGSTTVIGDRDASRTSAEDIVSPISTIGSLNFGIPSAGGLDTNADTAYHPPSRTHTRKSSKDQELQRSGSFKRTSYFDRDWTPDQRRYFESFQNNGKTSEGNSMTSSVQPPSTGDFEEAAYKPGRMSGQMSHGQVHQKLASDSIQTYTMNPAHLGSAAELVDPATVEGAETSKPATKQ